eukprot:4259847-Pyramimonas_sp.AAC.1
MTTPTVTGCSGEREAVTPSARACCIALGVCHMSRASNNERLQRGLAFGRRLDAIAVFVVFHEVRGVGLQ